MQIRRLLRMINPKEITFSGLGQEIITVIIETRRTQKCYKSYLDDDKSITLQDIEDRIKNEFEYVGLITVLAESPLSGAVYQYGNYGGYWTKIGDLIGYA